MAAEAWATHLQRNRSVIVDNLQGQLKSRLDCPTQGCGRVSITFDPFMFLSVPVPVAAGKSVVLDLTYADSSLQTQQFTLNVPKTCFMRDVKAQLAEQSGVKVNH